MNYDTNYISINTNYISINMYMGKNKSNKE